MKDKLKAIILDATCKECGAVYGYEEHEYMVDTAVEKVNNLMIENSYSLAPLMTHQRMLHEFTSEAKKSQSSIIRLEKLGSAIDILEELYPKLKRNEL